MSKVVLAMILMPFLVLAQITTVSLGNTADTSGNYI